MSARATFGVYRLLGGAMQRMPEPLAEQAARAVGLSLTVFRADAKAMYARHLRRVVGGDLTDADVRTWTRRAFSSYARYWLEGARMAAVPAKRIEERMSIVGFEYLEEARAKGNGVIVALPHVGSWEWGGAWLALQGHPMTAVAERIEPPEMFEWFAEQRRRMGLNIVKLDTDAGSILLRTLRDGGVVGLLCDRDLQGNGVEVEFFGERTTLPAGPATLALRSGAVILPAAVYSGPGRHHNAVIMPPVPTERTGRLRQDVVKITQRIAHDLEVLIRRAPEQWHLFQPNWPSDPEHLARAKGEAGPGRPRVRRAS